MKKVLFVLSLILISFSSCKKDEVTGYTQANLNGTWENVVVTDGVAERLVITSTSLTFVAVIQGIEVPIVVASKYSFDGTKISYTILTETDELTINELTSTKLVVTTKSDGSKAEYKKIN
jgi:hypothetical protein